MSRLSARARQQLEASFYYNERRIADAREELARPGISAAYRKQMEELIDAAQADMRYAQEQLPELTRNGRATTVDDVAARELSLFIENDYALIGAPNSRGKAIHANLERKVKNGTYDPAQAPAAWQYLIDEGAKKYEREFGDSSPIFNAATRRSVATDFARAWEEENGVGGHRRNGREQQPLRFGDRAEAQQWLRDTENHGRIEDDHRGKFIILQFDSDGVWAFAAPDAMVHLPGW